jgi:hypothetical protein
MARVNSFLRGSRKHDIDLRRKRKTKWSVSLHQKHWKSLLINDQWRKRRRKRKRVKND